MLTTMAAGILNDGKYGWSSCALAVPSRFSVEVTPKVCNYCVLSSQTYQPQTSQGLNCPHSCEMNTITGPVLEAMLRSLPPPSYLLPSSLHMLASSHRTVQEYANFSACVAAICQMASRYQRCL